MAQHPLDRNHPAMARHEQEGAAPVGDRAALDADIRNGLKVLHAEIRGMNALAAMLDERFARAVDAIHRMKKSPSHGRLIIAGIGKSGHVGRKLAATLASTGTPSHFVHASEASHGDLGMVTTDDIVLLLSNSGESPELADLIHYTRRFAITLIGMTARPDSALGRHADILLQLPGAADAPEACPNGLAPTTSTTMMMALGDALAVALLERMGLTPDQFKIFHPGGKLGQRLVHVHELMHKRADLPMVGGDAKMDEALLALTGRNLGCVLVMGADNSLAGIITDGDLKRHMSPDLLSRGVGEIMSRSPKMIGTDALAVEALNMMTRNAGQYLTSLVVTDADGKVAGLIRLQDCLQAGVA